MLTANSSIENRTWEWHGLPIHYQQAGTAGPALLLIHGFGASCDHWRKNLPPPGARSSGLCAGFAGFWQICQTGTGGTSAL